MLKNILLILSAVFFSGGTGLLIVVLSGYDLILGLLIGSLAISCACFWAAMNLDEIKREMKRKK